MANILKILHPFIPFFSETLWKKNGYSKFLKTPLIQAKWPTHKEIGSFKKNHKDIRDLMNVVSNIRSTKAELSITPKLFCDIIFSKKSKMLKKLINRNKEVIKQVARVNNLLDIKNDNNMNSIEILILKEKISLKFDEDIDINSQKKRILEKISTIEEKIKKLNSKLQNTAYINNAPKNIVKNDKVLLNDLIIEENKLRSIVLSIN